MTLGLFHWFLAIGVILLIALIILHASGYD